MKNKCSDKTEKKQSHLFQPGQSGNPKGRPKGSLNKATLLCQSIFADKAGELAEKAVSLALEGDTAMLKMLLDKTVPTRKDGPVKVDIPEIKSAADILIATEKITQAVTNGTITPYEGNALSKIFETHLKSLEMADIDTRLRILEER